MEKILSKYVCPRCGSDKLVREQGVIYCLGESSDTLLSKCFYHLSKSEAKGTPLKEIPVAKNFGTLSRAEHSARGGVTVRKKKAPVRNQKEIEEKQSQRGRNNLVWHLYETPDGEIYYDCVSRSEKDKTLILRVDPDIVWYFEFDKNKIIEYYSE